VRTRRIVLLAVLALLLLAGCGRRGAPVVPILIEPSPPGDLQAQVQRRVVILTWTRPTTNVDGTVLKSLGVFRISRREQAPRVSAFSAIATVKADKPDNAVVSGKRYAFTDETVVVGARYAYQVESMNRREIAGPPSSEATALVTVEIAAPSDLRAEAGERAIRLAWSAPTRRADGTPIAEIPGYNIYRGTNPGRYDPRPVNRGLVPASEFQDSDLVNDQAYYYIVKAVENQEPPWQEGLQSGEVSATPVDLTPPAPPQGVRAVPGPGTVVSLSWEPNREFDLLGYLVYRSDAPNRRPRRLIETPFTAPALYDRSVRAGGRYVYTVTAVDASSRRNESAPSVEVEVFVP
jgi:predicted phage tail protein